METLNLLRDLVRSCEALEEIWDILKTAERDFKTTPEMDTWLRKYSKTDSYGTLIKLSVGIID